mmetsp:Transcript_48870/g.72592  ORF Transcript_48870/g.72592 Transcript_48870/m.72592 type:complete len:542 (-) Transcript_48870:445-2070(-)|eukprot:CAMPEP_0195518334 /NCGR_PEP_ID=MMETSP0794_2-20130614/12684_1 /TAXON_ID=515487 /ORGANISM="Stephanopyxis turris, Strain CCMP 815" /LENGTH=541 /DNA_ID=CAMNT_0040647277 /DNA_START=96 /DNA_END=1721 /DNA_ORIENTATION=+
MVNRRRPSVIVKHDTEVVKAVKDHAKSQATSYDLDHLERHAKAHAQNPSLEVTGGLSAYEDEMRDRLSKAVFVGHINTDLDSVAGAIGAAVLFGGTAAISEPAEKLNGEVLFALKNCGIPTPPQFDTLPNSDTCDVFLVDHTEEKQMVPSIRESATRSTRIVGVIDHHALAASFQTSKPIFMDLRPWGSMCTILGYLFIVHRRHLPKNVAVLLLQAILSDTLNLRSVTTREADRSMVAVLSTYGGINTGKVEHEEIDEDAVAVYKETEIDLLAKRQFQAKTDWIVKLGAYEMVRGDQKDFTCGPWKFGIAVLEVTDTTAVMAMSEEILLELRLLKKEKGAGIRSKELDFAFLFVVNVVEQTSTLLIAGGRELTLAKAAFLENESINEGGTSVELLRANDRVVAPGSTIEPEETAMSLPKGYVSRKAQFVPAFFAAIENDFEYESKVPMSLYQQEEDEKHDDQTEILVIELKEPKQSSVSQAKRGRRSSVLNASKSSLVTKEVHFDDDLVKENEQVYEKKDGNLYDSWGMVRRASRRNLPVD